MRNNLNTLEFVRRRYDSIKYPEVKAVLRVQDQILSSIRRFLKGNGFIEILSPIIGPITDPGIRGAKQAFMDYYGVPYKLMSSMILYKQMIVSSFERAFSISPNIRLEPIQSAKTGRHLVEFRQVDIEMASTSYDDAMELAEEFIVFVVEDVKEKCHKELKRELKPLSKPFPKYTYKNAVELLKSKGHVLSCDTELPWEAEEALSAMHEQPFFIYDYPMAARGFYYREDPNRLGILKDFDLLYPEGFGEAASGGEREYTLSAVLKRMKLTGQKPKDYGWYLEMLKRGIRPSAGFGLGVERLTRWICGLSTVWEAVAFPKVPGIISP